MIRRLRAGVAPVRSDNGHMGCLDWLRKGRASTAMGLRPFGAKVKAKRRARHG
ncbi:hypothetical protein EV666_101303 [Camelimonas lactis]|uniref:Uncharacterized protein n=1 Tax=Camelimonas lactis TaxID=659006 RepID=A0A4R2H0K7_9HYPH|nr:hypothetical protein EV666_101303 [Camelimonas lactis]